MASSYSPSSSQEQTNPKPPTSRRLPPPCWSHDETVALIDAYRDKWYSLRRGNLRAPHWQEVADGVAAQCPLSEPPKTSIQCRHKMEKLRKRYRSEIQRIGKTPRPHRYLSSWLHFKRMDSMELGFSSSSSSDPSDDPINEEVDDENQNNLLSIHLNRRNQSSIRNGVVAGIGNRNGVRIKIPKIAAVRPPTPYMKTDYGSGFRTGMDRNGNNVMDEMVAAIGKLGDGILKVERMKMDMAKELESVRIKMEMKRTEMILESQQKLVDSFSETVMEKKKKMKRMATPES